MEDKLHEEVQQVVEQAKDVRGRAQQVHERADHDRDLLVQARAELAKDEVAAAQEASPEPGQRP